MSRQIRIAVIVGFLAGFLFPTHQLAALADGSAVDAGAGSAPAAAAVCPPGLPVSVAADGAITCGVPAAAVHDPAEDPLAAIGELRMARSAGWAVLVLCVLLMLTKAISYGAPKLEGLPVLGATAAWLADGKHAVYVASAGAVLAAAYNALLSGGSLTAVALAVLGAVLAQTHATTQAAKS